MTDWSIPDFFLSLEIYCLLTNLEVEKVHTGYDQLKSHNLRYYVYDLSCYHLHDQLYYQISLEQ